MSQVEPSNGTIVSSESCNTVEAQDKDLKIPFMNMREGLKREMNKPLKEIHEKHKQLDEGNEENHSRPVEVE